jgi:hypothetical protein
VRAGVFVAFYRTECCSRSQADCVESFDSHGVDRLHAVYTSQQAFAFIVTNDGCRFFSVGMETAAKRFRVVSCSSTARIVGSLSIEHFSRHGKDEREHRLDGMTMAIPQIGRLPHISIEGTELWASV